MLLILLTAFAVAPLAFPGFFQAHSGFLPAWNLHALDRGGFDLAWRPELGRLPDPIRGEGALPYLLAWPWLALTGSASLALRVGNGLAFVVGALSLYAWARPWLGRRAALLAALTYTYLPWHLATVYVRGAYAEAWLWAWLPLLLWSLDGVMAGRFQRGLVGLGAVLVITWTQRGLMVLLLTLVAAYAAAVMGRPRRWRDPLTLALAGVGGAVLGILAWSSAQLAPATSVPFADHGLYPFQLASAAWDFGASAPGWGDGLSFQLGLAAVGLSVTGLVLYWAQRPGPSFFRRNVIFWAGATLLVMLLSLQALAPLWTATGLAVLLTYPWQVLLLTAPGLAFLSGIAVHADRRLWSVPMWAGLVALVILASYPYLAPRFTQVEPGADPVGLLQAPPAPAPQVALVQVETAPRTAAEITATLTVTLTWQALEPMDDDYTVFVHLLAPDGERLAQHDGQPADAARPTSVWQPGDIVEDPHRLEMPASWPAGTYQIATGMYSLATGIQLQVLGRTDGRVLIDVP